MIKKISLVILLITSINAKSDVNSEYANDSMLLKKATKLYDVARVGKEKDVLKAIESFKQVENINLKNLYIGSLIIMKTRYTILPWKKIGYVKEGSKYLDKSVNDKPESIRNRLIRFLTYINVPSFLGKKKFLEADVKYFILNYKKIENKIFKSYVLQAIVLFFNKRDNKKRVNSYLAKIPNEAVKQKTIMKMNE